MKKRLRSRVLAVGMVSSTLLGSAGLLYTQRALQAQDKPSAAALLERGAKLYDQQQYRQAKDVLKDIDPAQLPEDQRAKLADLLKNTDVALSKSTGANSAFDAAQADMDADKLAAAAAGFEAITKDASAAADVKEKAKIQLALVKEKQAAKAPQMKALLGEAQTLYESGKLDEADNALNTIAAVGADLGWQDNAKPEALRQKIAEKRIAMSKPVTAATMVAAGPSVTNVTAAAPAGTAPVPAASVPGVMIAPSVAPAPIGVTPPSVTGPDLLRETVEINNAQRDRALTQYNIAIKLSQDAAVKTQYDAAVSQAQTAIEIIDSNRQYFSENEANGYRDAAQKQLQVVSAQKASWDAQQTQIAKSKAETEDRMRAVMREKMRTQQVNKLMSDANSFVQQQQYREAADTLRQVLIIDRTNSSASLMLSLITDRINNREYDMLQQKRTAETVRQQKENAEELIPYADLLVYPEDWVELTRNRIGDTSSQESAANRAVRERLDENIKEISADNQGFEKVINFLRDNTNTNIFVNWKALEGAGIDRNTQVSVSLHEVSFKKALNTILSEVGGGTANLGYTIDDGVITISTRDDLNSAKYQVVRVFDIRDMLVQPDSNLQPPSFNLQQITTSGSTSGGSGGGGTGGGGGGGGLFNSTGGTGGNGTPAKSQDDIVKEIIETVKSTVAPDSWRDAGGTIGSIRELNGQLIVNQTVDNQTAVYNLLAQLRETRALQIAIEARMLLVNNNFLDDFGLGWGLSIPAGALGGNIGAVTVANNTDSLAQPPNTGIPGSLQGSFGGIPAQSAISLSGSIIDNWTLNLMLRATQADQRTTTLTAPRVTLFNGQSGYIAVTNQQNFVSNFNQTAAGGTGGIGNVGGGAVATNLTVSTLTTGVVLFVTATVSADRRYVVMKLQPQLSTLDGIDTFTNTGTSTSLAASGPSVVASSGAGFVQLPKISYTTVDTMVSVPDGGTLLIGGQRLIGEAEIEVGVPVLSKIPGLNRLFTNRSFVKDERTLLILVRPKIIIQKEEETRLFGPGYDRPSGVSSGIPTNQGIGGVGVNEGIAPAAVGTPTLK